VRGLLSDGVLSARSLYVPLALLALAILSSNTTPTPVESRLPVAAAILQLVDDGRVRLDDEVTRWLPRFPAKVTVRQLLGRTAGLAPVTEEHGGTAQLIEATSAPAPGGPYDPAADDVVLALIVEKATGMRLAKALRRLVGLTVAADPGVIPRPEILVASTTWIAWLGTHQRALGDRLAREVFGLN
jgi:hypothetical protein